jgi:hypothetical protein
MNDKKINIGNYLIAVIVSNNKQIKMSIRNSRIGGR